MKNQGLIQAGSIVSFNVTGPSNVGKVEGTLRQGIAEGVSFIVDGKDGTSSYTSPPVRIILSDNRKITVKTDNITYEMEI